MLEERKAEHLHINLEKDVSFPQVTTGLERYCFVHNALPELDLARVELGTAFLGKQLRLPLLISSMTGGTSEAQRINLHLAEGAQAAGIAMGLGSLRAALEAPHLADTFRVRHLAPDVLLFANLGAVQLNTGVTVDDCRRAVDVVEADALILHLNPLQEALQAEGDTNWAGLLDRIAAVCRSLDVPVVAQEVGWGISAGVARRLADAGAAAVGDAGAGGPSWSQRRMDRAPTERRRQQLLVLFQMTYIGAPMIYYGDEAGMWGANDPCDRKPMIWPEMEYEPEAMLPDGRPRPLADEVAFDYDLFDFYRRLIAIRQASPALRRGDYRTLLALALIHI